MVAVPLARPPIADHRPAWQGPAILLVAATTAVLLILPHMSGFQMQRAMPPGSAGSRPLSTHASAASCSWTPYSLSLEALQFSTTTAKMAVPSMVSEWRRHLSVQLAVGVLEQGVPGDFVETGTAGGGTTILMLKVLEKFDAEGVRRHWAADRYVCDG